MLKLNSFLAICTVVAIAFSSCKKDEESKTDLLVDGGCWKNTKSEIFNSSTSTWENETIEACDTDDCINFKADGTIAIDEGAVKCDPSDPQTGSGTWTLSADETTLTLVDNAFPIPLAGKILEFSSEKIVIEFEFFGDKYRDTLEN